MCRLLHAKYHLYTLKHRSTLIYTPHRFTLIERELFCMLCSSESRNEQSLTEGLIGVQLRLKGLMFKALTTQN